MVLGGFCIHGLYLGEMDWFGQSGDASIQVAVMTMSTTIVQ